MSKPICGDDASRMARMTRNRLAEIVGSGEKRLVERIRCDFVPPRRVTTNKKVRSIRVVTLLVRFLPRARPARTLTTGDDTTACQIPLARALQLARARRRG